MSSPSANNGETPPNPPRKTHLTGIEAPTNTPTGSNTPMEGTPVQKTKKSSPLANKSTKESEKVFSQLSEKLGKLEVANRELEEDDDDDDEDEDDEEDEVDEREHVIATLTTDKEQVVELKEWDDKQNNLIAQYYLARKEFELEFQAKFDALNEERKNIVTGSAPTSTEFEGLAANTTGGIREFWLNAMANHPMLQDAIGAADVPALMALSDIRVCNVEEKGKFGFRLEFEFLENDFFTNKVLTKEYWISNFYSASTTIPVLESVKGSTIDWRSPEVDLWANAEKASKSKKMRLTNAAQSFFTFFKSSWSPSEATAFGEEDYAARHEEASIDYEIADVIRRKIVPEALDYFLGVAEDEEAGYDDDEMMDSDDSDFEDDSDDDDDDDDEDDDDDDDDNDNNATYKPQYSLGNNQGEDGKQECKQQ